MKADDTKEVTAGATGVDEKAVEDALKTIRFTDIPDDRKNFPEKSPAAPPQPPKFAPPPPAPPPPQITAGSEIKKPPIAHRKADEALVPASIVMPHISEFDEPPATPPTPIAQPVFEPVPPKPPAPPIPDATPRIVPPPSPMPPATPPPVPVVIKPPAPPITPAPVVPSAPQPVPPLAQSAIPPIPPKPAPAPVANPPQLDLQPAGVDMKQDLARILEETKLPERRILPGASQPTPAKSEPTLARAGLPLTSAPVQEARLITPEGRSAPVLSRPPKPTPAPLEKNIVGEAVPPPKQAPQRVEGAMVTPTLPPMEKRPIVPSLRTLKDDLYDLVRVRKMSLIHAASLESDRKKRSHDVGSAAVITKNKRRVRLFRLFLTVAIFLAIGAAALFTVFIVQTERTAITPANFGTALVFAEQTLGFPLSPTLSPREVRQQLSSSRYQGNLTLGAVLRIVPTMLSEAGERPATAAEFMRALAEAPDELLRGLGNDFFFGVHTVDENVPFLILPVSSYENAFAAMLSWEPLLNEGLFPLFPRVHYEKVDEQGVPMLVRFEDVIIKNYDVRALRDQDGEIRMLYSFPSRNLLIIAESPHSFIEALARLRAERRI